MSPLRDLIVGSFLLAGLLVVAYLSISLGGLSLSRPEVLTLYAAFDETGGLAPRAPVVIGGVKVGSVSEIRLDEDFRAVATLRVDASVQLPEDTTASILTQGLLGDRQVALEPGGSDVMLQSGEYIEFTQSAVVLERLIGRLVHNLGAGEEGANAE